MGRQTASPLHPCHGRGEAKVITHRISYANSAVVQLRWRGTWLGTPGSLAAPRHLPRACNPRASLAPRQATVAPFATRMGLFSGGSAHAGTIASPRRSSTKNPNGPLQLLLVQQLSTAISLKTPGRNPWRTSPYIPYWAGDVADTRLRQPNSQPNSPQVFFSEGFVVQEVVHQHVDAV